MKNKSTAAALVCVCVCFLLAAWKYIKDSGILKGYPKAEYLTSEEAAARPAYGQLSADEKAVYTALYRGISEHRENILLPVELKGDDYSHIYCLLEKQEGSFFYLDSVYYTAKKVREARIVYRKMYDLDEKKLKLERAVETAVRGAEGLEGGDYKARYINDYLVKRCRYVSGDDEEYASTAYGCLVECEANCEGYAKAFNLLASELGVESVVITGKTDKGENHAWNQVRVGMDWYNIDVTWADTDVAGEMRQMYFLCDDEDFSKTHIADNTMLKPFECSKDDWNYYVRNGLYADSVSKAEEILRRELSAGSSVIELRFSDINVYERFRSEFINEEKIVSLLRETGYDFGSGVSMSLKENEEELCMTLVFSA